MRYDGYLVLVVEASGYAPAIAGPFASGPGQMHAGVVVRLTKGATVSGVVRDEQGRPVAGARVWLDALLGDTDAGRARVVERLRSGELQGRTGADGSFRIEEVPAGYDLALQAAHATLGDGASRKFVLRKSESRSAVDVVLTRR